MSSFIFLRFFAPAILSPNLFQLTPHHTVSARQSCQPVNWASRAVQARPVSPPGPSSPVPSALPGRPALSRQSRPALNKGNI